MELLFCLKFPAGIADSTPPAGKREAMLDEAKSAVRNSKQYLTGLEFRVSGCGFISNLENRIFRQGGGCANTAIAVGPGRSG
jgi:hypothetical protein